LAAQAGGDHAVDLFVAGAGLRGAGGKVKELAGVVGGLEDAGHDHGLVVCDAGGRGFGRADGVLEAVGAGELGVTLAEGGVLDPGAVEQLQQLGCVSVRGGGPRVDVCGGRELLAGLDLGDLRLPPPVAEASGELRAGRAGRAA
jgi:hypothetical protein